MLDISMQDAAVSATASLWHGKPRAEQIFFVRCADSYACIETLEPLVDTALDRLGLTSAAVAQLTREAFVTLANNAGVTAVVVHSVSEVACSEQTAARQLILEKVGKDGRKWPLLNSPLRLSLTPPQVCRPIGDLGEANGELPRGNR
jgi:hypothetical protein